MLPSRALSRSNPASALRHAWTARTQPARPSQLPLRHFSQARSRSTLLSRVQGASCTPLSSIGSRTTLVATASGAFSQRSGASRNLSLWPFSSKPQSSAETQSTSPAAHTEQEAPPTYTERPSEDSFASASSTSAPHDIASSPQADSGDFNSAQYSTNSFSDLDLNSVLDTPEQIGYLKALGLDFGWGPTSCCEYVLEHLYVFSGMPWWATIATIAVAWRAILFIPSLHASKHAALLQQLTKDPAFAKAKAEFEEAAWKTGDRIAQMRAREQMAMLKRKSGASSMRSMVTLWTIPFSYGMFRLLRAMAAIPVPSLETGGLAWFSDLTVHDPYYILPSISVLLAAAMFNQLRAANMSSNPVLDNFNNLMKFVLPPMMFLGTAWLPACIQWFFLVLTAGSVVQTSATLNPAVRRWAGLPARQSMTLGPGTSAAAATATWQAPKPPGQQSAGTIQDLSGSAKSLLGVDKEKEEWKKAQAYEARRALEEKEKAYRRMEDLRRKRAEKGGS
ncbi:60Kd inner membrane protein-domain-containing protein [Hypoxylon sp. FL0543]|nr:60Kd inner membrane protein-domain-containing protein [Hypoxylon sp. FL0543]